MKMPRLPVILQVGLSFIPKIINNLLDKIGSYILIYLLITYLPKQYRPSKSLERVMN